MCCSLLQSVAVSCSVLQRLSLSGHSPPYHDANTEASLNTMQIRQNVCWHLMTNVVIVSEMRLQNTMRVRTQCKYESVLCKLRHCTVHPWLDLNLKHSWMVRRLYPASIYLRQVMIFLALNIASSLHPNVYVRLERTIWRFIDSVGSQNQFCGYKLFHVVVFKNLVVEIQWSCHSSLSGRKSTWDSQ